MGLYRYQIVLGYAVAFLSIWYYLLTKRKDISEVPAVTFMIERAPVLAIVFLACYALLWLIVGVATFRDCPEAAAELEHQVKHAKIELRKRGILK
jgi:dolichyl-phosphate mannosyltransferase polypeptide 3